MKLKYSLLYIVFSTVMTILIWIEKEHKINSHLELETNQIIKNYNAVYNEYKQLSTIIFNMKIDTDEVKSIFKEAYKSDPATQQKIREKLYEHLKDMYSSLGSYNIKQLHFHLPDNRSFLRFHRPSKYGDDLSSVRETVKYVNRYKKPIDGFEEGRIYNGYRFVFPLFEDNGSHIGSVEVSFSTIAFINAYQENFKNFVNFLIPKKLVDKKVFKNEKKNYIQSSLSSFYVEKKVAELIREKKNHLKFIKNPSFPEGKIEKKLFETKPLSIYDKNFEYYFIPVLNPVTQKLEGVFAVKQLHHYILGKTANFYLLIVFVWSAFLVLSFLLYKNTIYKSNLKEQNKKLNTLIEEADSGMGIMDLEGNFLDINNTYSEILGYSKEELLGINCIDISDPEYKDIAKSYLQKAQKEGKLSKVHKVCTKKDGSKIHLEFSLSLLPSKKAFIVVINSMDDKIALKKLNNNLIKEVRKKIKELRKKDKLMQKQSMDAAMGEMIDAIAHQWKGPLNTIKVLSGYYEVEFDYKEKPDLNSLRNVSSQIDAQVEHLLDTLDEFRSFFRPNQESKKISLNNLISSVLLLMKDELIRHNIETSLTGDIDTEVSVIPNEFKHIIINLISNSKDAFEEREIKNRIINFNVQKLEDSKTMLKICDNAGGIEQDTINHIFEANFTTKLEGKGTGIGLYMTKQILDKHKAQANVYNKDNGVCFEIILNKAD